MKTSNFKNLDKYLDSLSKMEKEQLKVEIWKWLKICLTSDVITKISNDDRLQRKYENTDRKDLIRIIDAQNKDIGILKNMLNEYDSLFENLKEFKSYLSRFIDNNNPKKKKKEKYITHFKIDEHYD